MTASTATGPLIGAWAAARDWREVSDACVHEVGRAFLDTFAVRVAAERHPLREVLERYLPDSSGPARDWATGRRHSAENATLANAAMAHVLDYDDVTSPLRGHPSVVLLPALVAVAESENANGAKLSAAYEVGFEVIGKLAKALASEHYAAGWHATATIGGIGAAVAAGHLMALGPEGLAHAVGTAVAQASGTRGGFGTMAKAFQVGAAAASAVRSARLARAGITAPPDALETDRGGFVELYCGRDSAAAVRSQLAALGERPGELWSSGLDVKKYPLCYATHRALDLVLDLREEHELVPEQVERVEVRTNRGGLEPLVHHRPRTGLEAKFSMEFAVAAALHQGMPRLATFDDDNVRRPELQDFLDKVTAADDAGPERPRRTKVTVHLGTGDTLHRATERLRGSADDPLSDEELTGKVDDCARYGGSGLRAEELASAVFAWRNRPIRELLGQFVPTVAR